MCNNPQIIFKFAQKLKRSLNVRKKTKQDFDFVLRIRKMSLIPARDFWITM